MRSNAILTAAEMRAAEHASGVSASMLMERAGAGAAEAIWQFAGPMPTLVLCGPANNGGDGYVIARILRDRGADVRVAALSEPRTDEAFAARERWSGSVMSLEGAAPAPMLVDALFGTGLSRGLDEVTASRLQSMASESVVNVAVDIPSGVSSDDGGLLSPIPNYDMTIALGALKPAHLLQPAAKHMGRIVTADIGVRADGTLRLVTRPGLPAPGPEDHKYSRGYVAVIGGEMPGAAALAASAASRAGAGYVRIVGDAHLAGVPSSVVQAASDFSILSDPRIGAIAAGPGLGRGSEAGKLIHQLLQCDCPLILDADALFLLTPEELKSADRTPIITPHAGEFARLFGKLEGSKVDQAREAARRSGAVVVYKGSDTVIAAPDGNAAITAPAPAWLASAGTGDVLTGIVSAMSARGMSAFEAACAGAWLHGRAAGVAGPNLIADDLLPVLPLILGECL